MFKKQHIQKRKTCAILAALALVVAGGTVWGLSKPASAMTGEVICGMEEHVHTDDCYEARLICEQEESEEHAHTEECWQTELVCQLPEHTHTEACYAPVEENQPEGQPDESTDQAPSTDETESQQQEGTEEQSGEKPDAGELSKPAEGELPRDIPQDYTEQRTANLNGAEINVYAKPGTIPERAELRAELLSESSPEFLQAVQRLQAAGVNYRFVKALDIALYDEQGKEIEPQAPVYVTIDTGSLMSEEADPSTIQIQHHKEVILTAAEDETDKLLHEELKSDVVVESVVDAAHGLLTQQADDQSCLATFPVDSFSVFTVTSDGWGELNIKVQCVDERAIELPVRAEDIKLNQNHTESSQFGIMFTTNQVPKITGYQYDGKAYYMQNGHYNLRIYGIRYEAGTWFYYPSDNNSRTIKFDPQPKFEGENPTDSIRLVYKKVTEIPVLYRDTDYHPLEVKDAPGRKNPSTLTVVGNELDISNVDALPKSDTYFYVGKAYAGEHNPFNEVLAVFEENGTIYGITEEKKKIELSEETPLSLIYCVTKTGTPDIMEIGKDIVSTADKGLKINLFDYNNTINDGHKLKFGPKDNHGNFEGPAYNQWTGKDGGIYTGIVEDKLGKDGYPVVEGESLSYLFDPDECKAELESKKVEHLHTGLDHLFWQDLDGYYRYDSMTNFATIMDPRIPGGTPPHHQGHIEGGSFVVYQQPALPGLPGIGDNAKFLPFDKYEKANVPKEPNKDSGKQYHFGMTMEADFLMPPGGEVADTAGNHTGLRDMVFEFNGDDDVWVFIDGELALDLGGIHDRYGGLINFRTGEVTTNAPPMEHSGRKQDNLYGIKGDPNTMSAKELADAREKAGFGKYSKHNFKFFYLERGKGASNCEITFNLVPVEHGLVVGKRLSEEASYAAPTDHMQYQFRAEIKQPNGQRTPLSNTPFSVVRWEPGADPLTGGIPSGIGQTDENGYFWLKAGERANFVGAIDLKNVGSNENVEIFVSEIVQNKDVVGVEAWDGAAEREGTFVGGKDEQGRDRKLTPPMYDSDGYLYHTEKTKSQLVVSECDGKTIYQAELHSGSNNAFNWIDFENDLGELASLNITKQALRQDDDTPITGTPFRVKIELWDESKNAWPPLSEGSPYWILTPGDPNPTVDGTLPYRLGKDADGQITIEHGQTIHLKLLAGTKYRISEVLSDEDQLMYTVTYTGTVTNTDGSKETLGLDAQAGISCNAGVKAGSQHDITITNLGAVQPPLHIPEGAFALTKRVVGGEWPQADTKFNFYLCINDTGVDGTVNPVECQATYRNTPEGVARQETETLQFQLDESGKVSAKLFLYPDETVVITGLPEGCSLYVREDLTTDQYKDYEVSFQEAGKAPVVGNEIGVVDKTPISPIAPDSVVKVTCTNRLVPPPINVTEPLEIKKVVERTDRPDRAPMPSDLEKEFQFTIILKDAVHFGDGKVEAGFTAADGGKTFRMLEFTAQGRNYVAKNVPLKHGETLTLMKLPSDINVVVQETDHEGYTVTMNGNQGDKTTVFLADDGVAPYSVICVNTTGVEIPETGGHGRLPYYLLGTGLMAFAAYQLLCRRKADGRDA